MFEVLNIYTLLDFIATTLITGFVESIQTIYFHDTLNASHGSKATL